MDQLQQIFESVRDIPYRIPLTPEERNDACVGKHFLIKDRFEELGYKVRWAEGVFDWKDLGVPDEILAIEHSKPDYHVWLEVLHEGTWKTIDATWDPGLNKHLPMNEWADFGQMKPAVPILNLVPYEDVVIYREMPNEWIEHLNKDRAFLEALNHWIERMRKQNT